MTEQEHQGFSDTEIALIDVNKTIMEIIITVGLAKSSVLHRMLTGQRDQYLQKRMPDAAAVMEVLRKFAVDPKREAHREALRKLLTEPPRGSA